jgi:hypothetical protein
VPNKAKHNQCRVLPFAHIMQPEKQAVWAGGVVKSRNV